MSKKIDYASLYTRRKDGRYVATYSDENGRHHVYDKDPERLWHKVNDPKPEEIILFSSRLESWQNEHWDRISYKTSEAYTAPCKRILECFGNIPVKEISASMIMAYISNLAKQGYSRRTVQMHKDILNMIFNHSILNGDIRANPCDAVSIPKNLMTTKRELPPDNAIVAVMNSAGTEFGLFALICMYSGLRRGEALALNYSDIDRKNKIIHVNKAIEFVGNNPHVKEPKTAAGYRNAILPDILEEQIPEGEGYIFARPDGGPLTKTQYRKRWQRYCQEIGYDITAHQLRHGFATILYEAGVGDKDAQELLGHSDIAVTKNVYTHIRQSRKSEMASKINDFLSNMSK